MNTIRQRLTRRLLLGGGLLLVIGAVVSYFTARTALTHQFDEALRAKALALAGKSKWLVRQRTKTALHIPTGT